MANRRMGNRTAKPAKNTSEDDLKKDGIKLHYKIIALLIVLAMVGIAFNYYFVKPPVVEHDPIVIDRSIVFPRDGGTHDELMETWAFGGLLENPNGKRFGYQVRYWNTGRRDVTLTDEDNLTGSPYYYARNEPTDKMNPSANLKISNQSLDLTYLNTNLTDRWVESETTPFKYSLKSSLNIPYNDFLKLDLELNTNKKALLFGDDGKINLQNYGTMFTYLQSNVSVSGTMFIDGKSYYVTGFGRIEHSWGSWKISAEEIWNIMLSNGKEVCISRLYEPTTGLIYLEYDYLINDGDDYDVTLFSDVIPLKSNYSYEEYQNQNTSIDVNNYWLDPSDGSRVRCFIHDCAFVSNRNHYNLNIKPSVEFQRNFEGYEGTVDVSGTFKGQAVTGRGYITLISYYKSSLDISSVEDNSDYLMTYEIPNDPVHVTATIVDGIPLTGTVLYYRVNNGENITLPMELVDESSNEWGAVIPGQSLGTKIEYWVYTEDMATKWALSEARNYEVRIKT